MAAKKTVFILFLPEANTHINLLQLQIFTWLLF